MTFAKETPYKKNIRPGFVGDFLSREHVLAGGIKLDKAAAFVNPDAVRIEVTANAAADATSLAVAALSAAVPDNELLDFGGKKLARSSAEAAAGATAIPVDALGVAIADGDVAYYIPENVTHRVPAGTAVGLTIAEFEAAAADGVEWGVAADADDYIRLIAYDVPDLQVNNDAELLRPGTLIYVNFLPNWDTLSAAIKTKIRATYDCSIGTPGQEVAAA